jgi:bisphosphoglycerate-independent phosphoglycerate mutase (AlkP superfamily)
METTDAVFRGLLDEWMDEDGLIILTSDHGNMEVQGDRRHSINNVPTLAIGGGREAFADGLSSLADITPGILRVLNGA